MDFKQVKDKVVPVLAASKDKADHALDVTEEFIVQKIFKRQEKDIDSLLDSAWDMLMAKLKEKKDGKAS